MKLYKLMFFLILNSRFNFRMSLLLIFLYNFMDHLEKTRKYTIVNFKGDKFIRSIFNMCLFYFDIKIKIYLFYEYIKSFIKTSDMVLLKKVKEIYIKLDFYYNQLILEIANMIMKIFLSNVSEIMKRKRMLDKIREKNTT